MKIARIVLSKTVLTGLLIFAALLAFNLFYSKLDSELLASFNDWYSQTAPTIDTENAESALNSKVSVTITLSGVLANPGTNTWTFPTRSFADAEDRAHTARVLQLISESKVFGSPGVTRKDGNGSYVSVTVTDSDRKFDITVSAQTVEQNIQLQNLLKLLQVYAATPPPPVNPAQL
jgi:hypothetical protein